LKSAAPALWLGILNGKGDTLMDKKLKKKSLCKWGKDDAKKNWGELYDLLGKSKFVCGKCLRSSKLKGTLCKPEKLLQAGS
jgi:hypothetical protein